MKQIEWRGTQLQQLSDETIPLLFKWRNSSSFVQYLTARPLAEDIDAFINELQTDFKKDRHLQFIVFQNTQCVGTVYSYSYNRIDKYCFISIFTDDNFNRSGYVIKAALLFCKYLFDKFSLFKIYFDTYEYNKNIINLLIKREIKIEGHFYKQHLRGQERYDVIRFAIYKEQLQNWFSKYD